MVLSVTLNPCIDKTIYLDNLEIGAYNRVKNTRVCLLYTSSPSGLP